MYGQNHSELASNPDATVEQLQLVANISTEVNRALARNSSATGELLRHILWECAERDVETEKLALKHPNVLADDLLSLGKKYPSELFLNPSLERIFHEDPELLEELPELLGLPNCPDHLIRMAVTSQSRSALLTMLRNSSVPKELRHQFGKKFFEEEARVRLDEFLQLSIDQGDDNATEFIKAYDGLCKLRSCCIPDFIELNLNDHQNRLKDQLNCGFPYTSTKWPWPCETENFHSQPIAQKDLKKASDLLDEKLGDGLLQVWLTPSFMEPMVRIIPRGDLVEEMDDFYPKNAPWLPASYDESAGLTFYQDQAIVPFPHVNWIQIGSMYPKPHLALQGWCENHENSYFIDNSEELSTRIESIGLPIMESKPRYFDPTTRKIHLGGYARSTGNEADLVSWEDDSRRLLYYVTESEGIFSLAVTYGYDHNGVAVFDVQISTDH